jgi:hypothetical protein
VGNRSTCPVCFVLDPRLAKAGRAQDVGSQTSLHSQDWPQSADFELSEARHDKIDLIFSAFAVVSVRVAKWPTSCFETTTTALWLDTITIQHFGANMRNLNGSPARWVGWIALLCAFLALITPAGKQAVHC